MGSFKAFNLQPKMIDALKKCGYVSPSKIQEIVIPKILRGENVLGQSETGSGKTHAFLVPIINNVDTSSNELDTIIFSPTRELANQTWNFAKELGKFYPELRISLLTSGKDKKDDYRKASNNPHIIIGTPGRIKDVINSHSIKLNNVKHIVLDEGDMLLEYGFFDDIDNIISQCNNPQIVVFSATLKENIKQHLSAYFNFDDRVIHENIQTSSNVSHHAIDLKNKDIYSATLEFLRIKNPYSIIIFASTKEVTKKLFDYLRENNVYCGILHGELSPRERKAMIRRFRNDEFHILVSSDIGCRGIDIENVSDVLSVDLPQDLDYYYHRAGRTGRFDQKGDSYIFYTSHEQSKFTKILSSGLEFDYFKFNDSTLVEVKPFTFKNTKNKKMDEGLKKNIEKAKAQTKTNKVKPGYKKKRKQAIEKAKSKHKREIIRKDIRRQREERYKKEAKNNG